MAEPPSDPIRPPGARLRRIVPALLALVALGIFAALRATGAQDLSDRLLLSWGVLPFRFPFLDADTVMSALRCLRQGVDVFETNPCDALGRVYDYSPVWLHLAVLPFTEAWIVPVGLGVDLAFVAALLLLPAGRTWRCTAAVAVGVLSSAVAYAVERANNDLIIFVLAALAAALAVRAWPARLFGYACAFLAGLLKYYPMLLMALAFREKPHRFVAITITSVVALIAVVWLEYAALMRALHLIPTGALYADLFGARTLPRGVLYLTRAPQWWAQVGEAALGLASFAAGAALAVWGGIGGELRRLSPAERSFLLAGVALILGCFFTAQNIGYRATHLVLLLPGLSALAAVSPRRHLWPVTLGVALLLLWSDGWRHWIDAALAGQPPWVDLQWGWRRPDRVQFVAWELREAGWWWTVTVLWGVGFCLVGQSATGEALLSVIRPGAGIAGGRSPVRSAR